MKERKSIVVTLVLVMLFVTIICSPVFAKEFVLATIADPEQPTVKTRVAFLQECFKEYGYDLTVKYYPAERSLEAADRGVADGDLFREYKLDTTNYPNLVMIDCPLSYYPLYAYVTNPNLKIGGIQDLASYQVITMRGDRIMEAEVNPKVPKDKLTVVASYEQGFKMLAAGRADVIVSDSGRGAFLIKKLGIEDKVTMVKKPLLLVNLYTYINKKHAALAEKVAATMKAKMADGTYEKMVGVPPPKPDK